VRFVRAAAVLERITSRVLASHHEAQELPGQESFLLGSTESYPAGSWK